MPLDVYHLIHHHSNKKCGTKLTQGTDGTHQKQSAAADMKKKTFRTKKRKSQIKTEIKRKPEGFIVERFEYAVCDACLSTRYALEMGSFVLQVFISECRSVIWLSMLFLPSRSNFHQFRNVSSLRQLSRCNPLNCCCVAQGCISLWQFFLVWSYHWRVHHTFTTAFYANRIEIYRIWNVKDVKDVKYECRAITNVCKHSKYTSTIQYYAMLNNWFSFAMCVQVCTTEIACSVSHSFVRLHAHAYADIFPAHDCSAAVTLNTNNNNIMNPVCCICFGLRLHYLLRVQYFWV